MYTIDCFDTMKLTLQDWSLINMIERYSREEMAQIWTDQNRYEAWLEVEILASEAWSELGYIPKEDVKRFANMHV